MVNLRLLISPNNYYHPRHRRHAWFKIISNYNRASIRPQHMEALRICKDQHVPMTDELVEKLSPLDKELNFSAVEKNKILETIGDVCMDQRQYHLATKKFTQAGNRIKVCFCFGVVVFFFEFFLFLICLPSKF